MNKIPPPLTKDNTKASTSTQDDRPVDNRSVFSGFRTGARNLTNTLWPLNNQSNEIKPLSNLSKKKEKNINLSQLNKWIENGWMPDNKTLFNINKNKSSISETINIFRNMKISYEKIASYLNIMPVKMALVILHSKEPSESYILKEMESEKAASILMSINPTRIEQILTSMPPQKSSEILSLMSDETAACFLDMLDIHKSWILLNLFDNESNAICIADHMRKKITLYFMGYPVNINSITEKLTYEAKVANDTLTSKDNKKTTKILIDLFLSKLDEKGIKSSNLSRLINDLKGFKEDHDFPTYDGFEKIDSIESYVSLLEKIRDSDDDNMIMKSMALLWRSALCLSKNNVSVKIDNAFYYISKNKGRSHKKVKIPKDIRQLQKIKSGICGDSEIASNVLKELNPLYKLSEYYKKEDYKPDEKPIVAKNDRKGMPYLSGTSGMSNAFFHIYPLLDLDFDSDEGRKYAHLMASAIVAVGFHTYQECYDAFAITDVFVKNNN